MSRTVLLGLLLVLAVVIAEKDDIIIGIDLGTTYSCVAWWDAKWNRTEIIPNDQGNMITPSVVAFIPETGELLVGAAAKNQAAMNPENTVFDAKRKFDAPEIQEDIANLPCKTINATGKPMFRVKVSETEEKDFSPEEISAMVLQHLKTTAEIYLGRNITRAVITVPAYFNNDQRQATKAAGKIAGLTVERIINEPTSAAVAFGLKGRKDSNILVFDLGGGTFDVSLMAVNDGIYEVMATSGDNHLGGEDFDHKVLELFTQEYEKRFKTSLKDERRPIQKLKRAAEDAKKVLSSRTEEAINIDSLHKGNDFKFKLTRARFENINEKLFQKTLVPVERVLKAGELEKSDVDILLVGGSTRIPKVKAMLSEFFGGRQLTQEVQPDYVVAEGAAVVGAVIAKQMHHNVILVDVLSLSLGTEQFDGKMIPVVKSNSKIPTAKTSVFSTVADNQESVEVTVYQGEDPIAKNNQLLGKFRLEGIPKMKAGEPRVAVTYDVDLNGILTVSAVEKSSGLKSSITISSSLSLSDKEVDELVEKTEKLFVENKVIQEKSKTVAIINDKITEMAEKIEQVEDKDKKEKLVQLNADTMEWLEKNSKASLTELQDKQKSVASAFALVHDEL